MVNRNQKLTDETDLSDLLDLPHLAESVFAAPNRATLASEGEKYVVFQLDETLYAVHSRQVVELIGALPLTVLPMAPEWLAGIANLRGDIIQVIDLRKLWKRDTRQPARYKLLVLRSEREKSTIAFIVDRLCEIVALAEDDIKFSAADFESSFPTFFGRITHKNHTHFLLDAETLFASLVAPDA